MDTISMVKLLVENKKSKAINNRKLGGSIEGETGTTGSNRIGWRNDRLCWLYEDNTYYNSFVISDITLKMDWELIKEPVDFITAINSGKKIKGEGFLNIICLIGIFVVIH